MRQIIPSTPLPNGLRGIYALNPIGDHRVRALAHQAANQIATDFPDAAGVAPHMAGADDRALFIENADGEIVACSSGSCGTPVPAGSVQSEPTPTTASWDSMPACTKP